MTRHYSRALVSALLFPPLVAIFFYADTLRFEFVWDDVVFLQDSAHFRDWNLMWNALSEPFLNSKQYFRPLPLVMFTAEQIYSSGEAYSSHFINLVFFAGLILLVMALTYLLCRTKTLSRSLSHLAALAAGSFFALHPALTEPVAWISGRFDLTVTFFCLLTLLADRTIKPGSLRAITIAACFTAAALCKEMALGLALCIPFWHLLFNTQQNGMKCWRQREHIQTYAAILCGGLTYLVLRQAVLGQVYLPAAGTSSIYDDPIQHGLMILKSSGHYLFLTFLPFTRISPIHEFNLPLLWTDPDVVLGITLWFFTTAAIHRALKHASAWACLSACWVACLFPVLHFLPLTISENYVHERFLVLPLVIVAIGIGFGVARLWQSRQRSIVIPLALALISGTWATLGAASIHVNLPMWRNDLSLWFYAGQRHAESPQVSINLMNAYMRAGEYDLAYAVAEATREARSGQLYRGQVVNYAYLLHRRGQTDEALSGLKELEATALPTDRAALTSLYQTIGFLTMESGSIETARAYLLKAQAVDTHHPLPPYLLAVSYFAENNSAMAQPYLKRSLRLARPVEAQKLRDGLKEKIQSVVNIRRSISDSAATERRPELTKNVN